MQGVKLYNRQGRIVSPGIIIPGSGWPIRHLNANVAGVKQLLAAPGNDQCHFVTGFILSGGATGDGFHILRRNCIRLDAAAENISFADHGTDHNWGTKAANGDFRCEFWIKLEATTAAVPNLVTRGDEAADGWNIELTAASKVKFTIHDGTHAAATLTGATVIDDGEWHFICCVVDRSSATGMQIYVDGVADATASPAAVTDDMDGGTTVVITGVDSEVMYISTIGFYYGSTTPLTAADILASYNLGIGKKYSGSETGLMCGFNTDEGIGASCHDVKNDANNVGTITSATWVPSKQNGATAAIAVQGVPFEATTVEEDTELLDAMGKFRCATEIQVSAVGSYTIPSVLMTFPHAVKIGRNNPLRILETDGSWDLVLFGCTEKY